VRQLRVNRNADRALDVAVVFEQLTCLAWLPASMEKCK
jgi:hypothetical protein